MKWRARARVIIAKVFDWRADLDRGVVRVTASGATAGFGETEPIARAKAIDSTLRDLEREHCHGSMNASQRLDAVRGAAIRTVQGFVQ